MRQSFLPTIIVRGSPMNTLLWFVILYWVISVGIGLYAARYVNNSKDYDIAGRALRMYVVTATVFATWFGSETVLGISSTFVKEGLRGVVSDPFGSSLCLILVGLFFARPLYRMNLLTIGDFYRNSLPWTDCPNTIDMALGIASTRRVECSDIRVDATAGRPAAVPRRMSAAVPSGGGQDGSSAMSACTRRNSQGA